MNNDPSNPFNWHMRTGGSIFAHDPAFRARKDGKSNSQVQSEVVDERRSKGENVGSMHGIGKTTMKNSEERAKSLLAFKHFGTYAKAHPSKKPNKHEK
jgi:hypothetical protein